MKTVLTLAGLFVVCGLTVGQESKSKYGPVPSLVVSGKTGKAAYEAFPEPYRGQFIKAWEEQVAKAKAALETVEKDYARHQKASIPSGALLAKDRKAIAAAKETLAAREKNDPPYFVSDRERRKAEFAALPREEQEGRTAELEKQVADAEKARKGEDELDVKGLVLLKKTLEGKTGRLTGEITGTVVNRRGKTLRYVEIKFNLYDKGGARVGTALANVTGLEAGSRWNFKAVAFGDFDTFKLVELSGY